MQKNNKTAKPASPGAALLLGALGVVYGDIGTSPLYTLKASLSVYGGQVDHQDVIGVLSILFWLLILVVSIKYVLFMLRADNKGEGGILALMELAIRGAGGRHRLWLIVMGIFGACLFYGDSIITPAISVLSALEGIGVVSHALDKWVVPLSVIVIIGLFWIQSRGTGAMGKLFGPVMLLWFFSLALFGIWNIIRYPGVLQALNPLFALAYVIQDPLHSFLLLGYVVLALTGAEALYADMGHFGRPAIKRVWFWLVLPALLLCYFGQGAAVLMDPAVLDNPFYLSLPSFALWPMLVLATLATVIASQAVISGAFSVTRQAVQLGFWPHMEISHTSDKEKGQIYLHTVNRLLLMAVLFLVLVFQSSEHLAHAYGFAVTGTMLMTSILAFRVLPRRFRGIRHILVFLMVLVFLLIDILLFSANALKIAEGGWIPLVVGLLLFTMMMTWYKGRAYLSAMQMKNQQALEPFLELLMQDQITRVPGTAVFMSAHEGRVPSALLHNLKHNKVLQRQLVFLTVKGRDEPYVTENKRYVFENIANNAWQLVLFYGFKEDPNVPEVLGRIAIEHPEIDLSEMQTSYFVSRQSIVLSRKGALHTQWLKSLFTLMSKNAMRSTRYYKIPPNRVIEMGMQIEL
ncbi:putative potassium transport system protein kup [Advenella faeciporci]|uniref:Probable potassium transport system protein Kup n=1 Tax=Advenella faeciporci TaxID=797535 RepID=A0A918JMX4_9BURK|nr:potassium transporter Kup [Advenella faeciporci]GGW91094.1 putative potassium transport system protein kup [Advenella faeciporci]